MALSLKSSSILTENHLVGIDIGSEKTAVAVALPGANGGFEILGLSTVPTAGLKAGALTSIPELSGTIEKAVIEAESLSGRSIQQVHLSLFGDYFRPLKRQGETEIRNRQGEVNEGDRQTVIRKALPSVSSEFEIIHTIVQEYFLDDQRQITNPIDMSGEHLGVGLFVISAATTNLKNIRRCVQEINLEVQSVSFSPLVGAEAVLTQEEIDSGVAYLEMGRSAATLLVFQPKLREVEMVGRGGERLTYALAYVLKTGMAEAERIKREYGTCLTDVENQEIPIANVHGEMRQPTSRREVAEIIEAEVKDLLVPFDSVLKKNRPLLTSGLVLGGGGVNLSGLPEFLEEELDMPVRIGTARQFHGWEKNWKSPAYNAVLGAVQSAWAKQEEEKNGSAHKKTAVGRAVHRSMNFWRSIWRDFF